MKIKPTTTPGRVTLELDPTDPELLSRVSDDGAEKPKELKLKRILVPTDFSDCARKALQYALPMARQFGAEIVLVHVVQVSYFPGGELGAIDYALLEKELREGGQKQLEEWIRREIGEDIPSRMLLLSGQPVREIAETARKEEVDLIILSTHGRTGFKHLLLGSTAENVVRYAPCPVLVVRENEHEFVNV
jgi:universal stress protein A